MSRRINKKAMINNIAPVEIIADHTLLGIGICTVYTAFRSRSLFAVFWQKEEKAILIDIFFVNFKVLAS